MRVPAALQLLATRTARRRASIMHLRLSRRGHHVTAAALSQLCTVRSTFVPKTLAERFLHPGCRLPVRDHAHSRLHLFADKLIAGAMQGKASRGEHALTVSKSEAAATARIGLPPSLLPQATLSSPDRIAGGVGQVVKAPSSGAGPSAFTELGMTDGSLCHSCSCLTCGLEI
jgi:hypothetical protein